MRVIVLTTVHYQAQDKSFGGVRNSLVGWGWLRKKKWSLGLSARSWQGVGKEPRSLEEIAEHLGLSDRYKMKKKYIG